MTIREQILAVEVEKEPVLEILRQLNSKKYKLVKSLSKRIKEYLLAQYGKQLGRYDVDEDEFDADEQYVYATLRYNYDGDYHDTEQIPWNIFEMSDKDFNDWVEEQTREERIAEEARKQADEATKKEFRRLTYEELKKEFES